MATNGIDTCAIHQRATETNCCLNVLDCTFPLRAAWIGVFTPDRPIPDLMGSRATHIFQRSKAKVKTEGLLRKASRHDLTAATS